jgi:hypothetical protein
MRAVSKIFLLAGLIFSLSCEDQGVIVKCPDCTTDEPSLAVLDIKLDSSIGGNSTLVSVYEGNLEDSVLYKSLKTYTSSTTVSVSINKKYTATAKYFKNGKYYIAVDAVTPRVRYDKTQCDNPCYFVYNRVLNLRLKYSN